MKKVFGSSSQVSHVWAQQSQEEGRAGNIFFEGDTIYSYGYHFAIGQFVKDVNGHTIVLLNSNSYSTSTANHKFHVWRAISHIDHISIPFPDNIKIGDLRSSLIMALKDIVKEIEERCNAQLRAKSTYHHKGRAQMLADVVTVICSRFDIDTPNLPANYDAAMEHGELMKSNRAEWREAQERKEAEKERENLIKWLAGDFNGTLHHSIIHFRLIDKGETLQTTKGARVPFKVAKSLYEIYKSGKDIAGSKIGNFTVNSVDDTHITIGCHTIRWDIVHDFFNKN